MVSDRPRAITQTLRSSVQVLCCPLALPVRHRLMPGSDRLVLGNSILIRVIQSGIATITIVVVTTLAKVEPPWQCGAIERVHPIEFLFVHCQVFLFSLLELWVNAAGTKRWQLNFLIAQFALKATWFSWVLYFITRQSIPLRETRWDEGAVSHQAGIKAHLRLFAGQQLLSAVTIVVLVLPGTLNFISL